MLAESVFQMPIQPDGAVVDAACQVQAGRQVAFNATLDGDGQIEDAFLRLANCLMRVYLPDFSIWSTPGSGAMLPVFRVYEGLPRGGAYSEMLRDQAPAEVAADASKAECGFDGKQGQESQEKQQPEEISDGLCFKWQSSAQSNVGKQRSSNEDAFLQRSEIGLWAVADGMGGAAGGNGQAILTWRA